MIRDEQPGDERAIRAVNEAAFGGTSEADIVDALRANGGVTLSLVAIDSEIVGHILFSPVTIDRGASGSTGPARAEPSLPSPLASLAARFACSIVGLAPMAVLPSNQRRGIGSELVRVGLERLKREGHAGVIVLGHPEFYPRFGFARASSFGLRWKRECRDEVFMALELVSGALGSGPGVVRYRPELD